MIPLFIPTFAAILIALPIAIASTLNVKHNDGKMGHADSPTARNEYQTGL